MFSNRMAMDETWIEATVMSVDSLRFLCAVRTVSGQNIYNVTWMLASGGSGRGGVQGTPVLGDSVVISYGLGYPLIIGYLPRMGSELDTFQPSIHDGEEQPQAGSGLGSLSSLMTQNPNKPSDMITGDHLITSEGGGMIGVLRGGSVLLKASGLCQVFMSKFDDLMRVVARNLEVFTDVCGDYYVNYANRLYRYVGWTNSMSSSLESTYQFEQIYGNVAAGLVGKDRYSSQSSLAEPGSVIFHENVGEKMTHDYDLDGTVTRTVANVGTTYTEHKGSSWRMHLVDGSYADITATGSALTLDYNGSSKVVLDGSQASVTFNSTNFCTMTDGKATIGAGGHQIEITASGINMT